MASYNDLRANIEVVYHGLGVPTCNGIWMSSAIVLTGATARAGIRPLADVGIL